jgi:3-dehydroquinate synthase
MHILRVSPGPSRYNVYIGPGVLGDIAGRLKHSRRHKRVFLVTNPDVFELHGFKLKEELQAAGFETGTLVVPEGEEFKSLETAGRLYTELASQLAERNTSILALGGGVIGDLAGFVAATYMRGMPLIQIPTTLLAQVDSSIGGKTAVNHGQLKNQIGVFYQPSAVFSDTSVLRTLPPGHISNGLSEVIKSAVIGDPQLFALLEQRMGQVLGLEQKTMDAVIMRTAGVKARIVNHDERDRGLRNLLNLGHTTGHAIETVTRYKINHGTAVAIGMIVAARISRRMGLFSQRDLGRLTGVIMAAGLPTSMPDINTADVLEAVKHDKKITSGRLKFILPSGIGKVIMSDRVDLGMVAQALEE